MTRCLQMCVLVRVISEQPCCERVWMAKRQKILELIVIRSRMTFLLGFNFNRKYHNCRLWLWYLHLIIRISRWSYAWNSVWVERLDLWIGQSDSSSETLQNVVHFAALDCVICCVAYLKSHYRSLVWNTQNNVYSM